MFISVFLRKECFKTCSKFPQLVYCVRSLRQATIVTCCESYVHDVCVWQLVYCVRSLRQGTIVTCESYVHDVCVWQLVYCVRSLRQGTIVTYCESYVHDVCLWQLVYCVRSLRQGTIVTCCESYVHDACVCVAVVEMSSWRSRSRNPGTISGVMWMDIAKHFDARDRGRSYSRSCVCNKMWVVTVEL